MFGISDHYFLSPLPRKLCFQLDYCVCNFWEKVYTSSKNICYILLTSQKEGVYWYYGKVWVLTIMGQCSRWLTQRINKICFCRQTNAIFSLLIFLPVLQDLQQLDVNLLCWGSGELGQTVSVRSEVMSPDEAHLREFTKARLGAVKLLSCGSSHCVVVTGN